MEQKKQMLFQKALAILLAFSLVLGNMTVCDPGMYAYADTWDGSTVTPADEMEAKMEGDVYLIETPADLAGFAQIVNEVDSGANGRLNADIDMGTDNAWTPIGNYDEGIMYSGHFEGDGHTVNVSITEDAGFENAGLFGAASGATIEGIVVQGEIYAQNSAGGIVGYGEDVTIKQCRNEAKISAAYEGTGGILGAGYGKIEECANKALIYSDGFAAGGILGISYGDVNLKSCYNQGEISSGYLAAGILGYLSDGKVQMNSVYSSASVQDSPYAYFDGRKLTGTITGDDVGEIFTGYEQISGQNIFGYFPKEQLSSDYESNIKNYRSFSDLADRRFSMADLVSDLNNGESVFVEKADEWPILKWEQGSQLSPEELQELITAAKTKIEGIGADKDYDALCSEKVKEVKNAALTRLEKASSESQINQITDSAVTALNDIPTIEDKTAKKDALVGYSEADYETDAWKIIEQGKTDFETKVDNSVSKKELETELASLKTLLDDVITKNKKTDLLTGLDNAYAKYSEGDYKPENWQALTQTYESARNAIEKETSAKNAAQTQRNAITAMKGVLTILSELRETKKAELTKYFEENYNEKDYSAAKWKEITNPRSTSANKGYYNNALTAIAKGTSEEAIDEIIAKAKANMESVYTLKQEAELASYKTRLKAELDSRLAAVNKDDYKESDYSNLQRSINSQKSNIDYNAHSFEQVDEYYEKGLNAIQDTITLQQRAELLDRIEEAYQRCLKNKDDYDEEDWAVVEKNYNKKSELNSTSSVFYAKKWADGYIRAMNNVLTKTEKADFEAGRSEVLAMLQTEYAKYEANKADYDQNCGESEEGWSKLEKINREAIAAIKKVQKDEGKAAMTAIYEQAVTDMAAVVSLVASREKLGNEMQMLTQGYLDSGLYTQKGKVQLEAIREQAVQAMNAASSVKAIQAAYEEGAAKLANVIESSQESDLNAAIAQAMQELQTYFDTKYPEANKDKYEAADWETLNRILTETLEKMQAIYTKSYAEELTALRRGAEEKMSEISVKSEKIAKLVTECMVQIGKACTSHTAALDFANENLFETFASFAYDLWFNSGENLKAGIAAAKAKIQEIYENAKARLEGSDSSSEVTQRMNEILAEMDSAEKEALTITNSVPAADKWDGSTKVEPQSGDGSEANPYQIGTAAELAWFADTVNLATSGSKPGSGLCAVLTADIDLAGYNWTPIARTNDLNGKGYLGVFDGNGHTVHNMKIDTAGLGGTVDCGLFGTLGKGGTIKNLHIAGTLFFSKSEDKENEIGLRSGFGGIVGIIKSGTVYNCISSVKIDRDVYKGASHVGGIAGRIEGGMIDRCRSYAFFTDKDSSGYSYAGGIVGLMESSGDSYSMVRYCTYEGSFAATGSAIGGIAGSLERNAIVRECINRAPIGKERTAAGSAYTGGIAGFMDNNSKVLYVYNEGEINGGSIHAGDTAPDGTGGIVGCEGGETAKGDEKALPLISDAYNRGTVKAELRAGGLVGRVTKGKVTNAQSCSGGRMFGYVENAGTKIENAVLTEQVDFQSTGEGNSAELALAKLTHTQTLLAKYKAEDDAVYGVQTKAYNDLIDTYIRKIEEAATVDAAAAAAAEAEEALAKVNTELGAQKEDAIAQLRAYVASRVYDSKKAEGEEQSIAQQIAALLEEAVKKVEAAENLKAVSDILMEYLGTEDTAGKFAYFETYNTQTVKGLYSDFLYNKAYDAKDMAAVQDVYEKWAEAILQADSEKKINELAAEAKKELTELTKNMTVREPGENASLPAYEKDESDALSEEKEKIYQELAEQYDWKDYGQEEWEQVSSTFEGLRLALKNAQSSEEVKEAAASAKAALEKIETLDEQALTIARNEAETTLKDKIEGLVQDLKDFFNSKTKEIGEEKIQASHLKEALEAANTDGEKAIREAGENVSFAEKAFNQIRETLKEAAARAENAYQAAKKKLAKLFEKVGNAGEGAWDGSALTKPEKGSGTAEDPYQITTGAELAWFGALVSGTLPEQSSGRTDAQAILMKDINLSYQAWNPIGNSDSSYRGVFDGNGHRVSGMSIRNESNTADKEEYYGLFGAVYGGSIKNLTVEGEIAVKIGAKDRIGGIVGKIASGSISACVSEVDIQAELENNDAKGYGGIAGEAGSTDITSCVNRGSLTISDTTCAVALGGIVGLHESSSLKIEQCVNLGEIKAYKAKGTGGILGYATAEFTVNECANLANITIEVITDAYGSGGTGGIVGVAAIYNSKGLIKNVYNSGRIKVESMAGGILGGESYSYQKNGLDNQPTESVGTGSQNLVMEYCYNAGAIAGPTAQVSNKMASIAGLPIEGAYMTQIYMLEDTAKSAMGYISTKGHKVATISAAALKEKEPKEIFTDDSSAIRSIAEINNGYPIFSWQILLRENRKQIENYLQNYYKTLVQPIASQKQQAEIEALLTEKCGLIKEAAEVGEIINAYEEALRAMNVDELLESVKTEAKNTLTDIDSSRYPQNVRKQIEDLLKDAQQQIEAAENAKQIDEVMNGVYAGIVDLLIEDIENPEFKPASVAESNAEAYREKIKTAKDAYQELTQQQKDLVQNYIKIAQAEHKYQDYCDRSDARDVDDKIAAIGKVSSNSESKIKEARSAYEALSESAKKYVTLLDVLEKAEADFARIGLKEVLKAEDVVKMIDAIGKVTLKSYDKIVAATKAYNELTQQQAAAVPAEKVEILKAAMRKYNALLEAAKTGTVIVSITPAADGKKASAEAETETLLDAVDTALQVEANAILLDIGETEAAIDEIKLILEMSPFKQLLAAGKTKVKIKTIFGEIVLEGKTLEKLVNDSGEKKKVITINAKGNDLGLTQQEPQPVPDNEQPNADTENEISGQPFRPSDLKWNGDVRTISANGADKGGISTADATLNEVGTIDNNGGLTPEETVQVTKENPISRENTPFDWSILFMLIGIAAAFGIGGGLIKWFAAAKHSRRK